ncbi:hypothetical protein [Rhodohalobacter sp.]|uniref:hypothetical protein n=1 Tax=Rhodohalobacter sp. TaxID=1974210 RepID=UPI002ACD464F|nr:hypothetical protein [Rhodohalobacter sp.]MDZ7755423.1 hypothetical protein [Rhodohalobacter sp.]
MLKIWIEQIKNKPDHYGVDYWKYNVSGNILELYVQKEYLEHEHEYRKAVISIGKVLQALRHKLTDKGHQYHIQTFPNLDNSALIAAVRILSKSPDNNSITGPDSDITIQDEKLLQVSLESFARANQLTLHEIKSSDLSDVVIPAPDSNLNWFALCANNNNPFIWLRVGYWQEYMSCLETRLQTGLLVVTDTTICSNRLILCSSVSNRFVQLLLGIPKEVTAG